MRGNVGLAKTQYNVMPHSRGGSCRTLVEKVEQNCPNTTRAVPNVVVVVVVVLHSELLLRFFQ